MDPNTRLRVATRIHFALLRHFDEDLEVSTLLRDGADVREVLWVFEASGNPELAQLADQFKASRIAEPSAPQDAVWSRDTSGFGISQLSGSADTEGAAATQPASAPGWRSTLSWLRRRGTAGPEG